MRKKDTAPDEHQADKEEKKGKKVNTILKTKFRSKLDWKKLLK